MATPTIPAHPRKSSGDKNSFGRIMSHGRGGAGNIRPDHAPQETESEIRIPTLKAPIYTTGRGGSGNMAQNDPKNPQTARKAQDVESDPPRAIKSVVHGGRGGAGNVVPPLAEEEEERFEVERLRRLEERGCRNWAEKSKDAIITKIRGSGSATATANTAGSGAAAGSATRAGTGTGTGAAAGAAAGAGKKV
ncbi:hypothetical protein BZA77DRAFT_298701 [Pyronema omphalodes]|nr:hypothetical protein BZA77DRAFT_298701 [Pyronema omphalodes]